MFNIMEVQTGRILSDEEVNEINYIIKSRAYRYVAAPEKEWLYPEQKIRSQYWDRLGRGYLLMPDPRSITFSTELVIGYKDKTADAFDPYGRRPGERGYRNASQENREWGTLHAFQGEFARVFGPKRRGSSWDHGMPRTEDSPDYHKYHLDMESKFKPKGWKGTRGR